MNHVELKKTFDYVEYCMAALIKLGEINSPNYKELDRKYELLKRLLNKPAVIVETCECGQIKERFVPATKAPKIFDSVNESAQFMVYEINHDHCVSCKREVC